jgi:hypothetical protein
MSSNFRIATLARAAAISMAVVLPAVSDAATSAFASDPSGGDPAVEMQSAQSARYGNPNDTPLARATAAAKAAAASAYAANPSNVASDASKGRGRALDLDGQGGAQDQFDREIYHPGTGTDW